MKIFLFFILIFTTNIHSFKLSKNKKRELMRILRRNNNLMNIKTDFFLYILTITYIINTLPKNNLFHKRKFYSPMDKKLKYVHKHPEIFGIEI